MTDPPTSSVTRDLAAACRGDGAAAERLMPQVYEELRALAGRALQRERRDHTLQPTAIVHEAYLRLIDQTAAEYASRTHFFAIAAQMIRRVLVDHARRRRSVKRGGQARRLTLSGIDEESATEQIDVVALDDALERLARLDPRQARVVELRFFGGLGVEDAARILDVSPRTVEGDWRMARAWLRRELLGEDTS